MGFLKSITANTDQLPKEPIQLLASVSTFDGFANGGEKVEEQKRAAKSNIK